MPIDKDTLDLIDKKVLMIDYADQSIINSVRIKEAELKAKLLKLLDKMKMVDGKIDKKDPANKKLLMLLNKDLLSIINKSSFKSEVSKYLKNFDDVEKISKTILEKVNGMSLKDYNLNKEKTAAIDEIAKALLNEKELSKNIINPIKKILHRHVTTGISMKDARKEIQTFIDGDHVKHGFMAKYVRSITQEALGRFDGGINQRVSTEFGLDAFSIVGSLIKTSSQVCVNMIREVGAFENMAVNGKYAISDLPNIIAILKLGDGFVKGTTETNYFIMRNHWGCRHQFIPTRFLKRDKEEMQARLTGATNPVSVPVAITVAGNVKSNIPVGFDVYEKKLNVSVDKKIFDYLDSPVSFSTKGDGGPAYYSSSEKKVVIKAVKRFKESKDMAERVVYHEFGHAIDAQKEYYKSEGIKNLMDKYRQQHFKREINFGEIDKELLSLNSTAHREKNKDLAERIGAVRDTIMSLNINYGYGHSKSYFRQPHKKEKEFIAHLFENKFMGNEIFKKYLPDLYDDMLNFEL